MQNILAAIAIAQAAVKVGADIMAAIRVATEGGRDLTPEELALVIAQKQSADALADAERRRLDDLFGGATT